MSESDAGQIVTLHTKICRKTNPIKALRRAEMYLLSAILVLIVLYKIQRWEYKDETPEEREKRIQKWIEWGQ